MKTRTPILALILVVVLVAGCRNTFNNSTKITSGMTKPELIAAIGEPDSAMSPGAGVEVLHYTFKKDRLYRLAFTLNKEYLVRLVDGKVEAYGTPRELARATPVLDPRERTVNLNIKTDVNTNTVAPVQPRVNINTD